MPSSFDASSTGERSSKSGSSTSESLSVVKANGSAPAPYEAYQPMYQPSGESEVSAAAATRHRSHRSQQKHLAVATAAGSNGRQRWQLAVAAAGSSSIRQQQPAAAAAGSEGDGRVQATTPYHAMPQQIPCPAFRPAQHANNLPLRGAKFSVFEGGMRTAAVVSAPGLFPDSARGSTSSALMHVSDWYVTILGLAGVDQAVIERSSGPQTHTR